MFNNESKELPFINEMDYIISENLWKKKYVSLFGFYSRAILLLFYINLNELKTKSRKMSSFFFDCANNFIVTLQLFVVDKATMESPSKCAALNVYWLAISCSYVI